MAKKFISGLRPTPPNTDPQMKRLDEVANNLDRATKMYDKKADKHTRPL